MKSKVDDSVRTLLGKLKRVGMRSYPIPLRDRERDGREIIVKKQAKIPMRIDVRESVNLYINDETKEYIKRLKGSTIVILYYIMEKLKKNDNVVELNPNITSKNLKMDYSTVYKAIKELIADNWIIPTEIRDTYTVNMLRFSKGDTSTILNKYDIEEKRQQFQDEIDSQIELRDTETI